MPRTTTNNTPQKNARPTRRSVLVECSDGYGGQHRLALRYTRPVSAWTRADLQQLLLSALRRTVPKERRRHPRLFGVHYTIERFDDQTRITASYGLGSGRDAAVWFNLPAGLPLRMMRQLLTKEHLVTVKGTLMLRTAGGVR